MSLTADVSAAIADAMRKKDSARLSALRMLKAAFMNRSIEKGHDLDDNEARQVVASLVKQRKDSIEQFTSGSPVAKLFSRPGRLTLMRRHKRHAFSSILP